MTTKIELSRSEDFSLVRRSTSLTESCNLNFVTHYFEVFLALRIRVLVKGSQNVTSEDFSLVHRSNFLTESGQYTGGIVRASLLGGFSRSEDPRANQDLRECSLRSHRRSFVILLTSSQQFR